LFNISQVYCELSDECKCEKLHSDSQVTVSDWLIQSAKLLPVYTAICWSKYSRFKSILSWNRYFLQA